jgi:hypothetical protein
MSMKVELLLESLVAIFLRTRDQLGFHLRHVLGEPLDEQRHRSCLG